MFVTDFDGTLYSDSHTVSDRNFRALKKLGKLGVTRVIATGRSLYSARQVIPPDFPVDYLVFSSGAGIMDWSAKEIIRSVSFAREQIVSISGALKKNNLDFMLHRSIPDNHFFYYYRSRIHGTRQPELCRDAEGIVYEAIDDFDRRCVHYEGFSREWDDKGVGEMEKACQFVVIASPGCEEESDEIFKKIKSKLDHFSDIHVIRTTSPIDRKTLWIEIFPAGVSKASGIKAIADMLGRDYNCIAAVGNDFNDLDMLRWVRTGFVVENAPEELRNEFTAVRSNNEDGFSEAVGKYLEITGLERKQNVTGKDN